ncbi:MULTISPECIES: hypothetical protein [unclassified Microcoleus]|uniref:hypothetical protein n=1 Tax=unclassified Microcoleus TaxID=2642155 RepID=UPI0025EF40F7|nr:MULTISPECIES: hypothetical protein [unclassified Microcoleus]
MNNRLFVDTLNSEPYRLWWVELRNPTPLTFMICQLSTKRAGTGTPPLPTVNCSLIRLS